MSFSMRMVRELKGAPLACYILIMGAGRPLTNDRLIQFSGYSDKPVSKAVALLSSDEYGLIKREDTGWVPSGETLMIFGISADDESRRNSDSTTTLNIKQSLDINNLEEKKGRRNSDSTPEKAEIWAELAKGFVFRNNRTIELVNQDFMSADYVRAWVEEMKRQKKGGPQWAGVLITTLEANMQVPVMIDAEEEQDNVPSWNNLEEWQS